MKVRGNLRTLKIVIQKRTGKNLKTYAILYDWRIKTAMNEKRRATKKIGVEQPRFFLSERRWQRMANVHGDVYLIFK